MVRIVEQVPVEARIVIPFAPLADLLAHENKFLARARPHVGEQRTLICELPPAVARHLGEHRAFPMHHFVMRQRQHEVLAPRVEQAEGEIAMMIAAIDRIEREVLERIVHPAHVPLEAEAKATYEYGTADAGPRGG